MAREPCSDSRFRRLYDQHELAIREYCSRRLGVQEANDAAAEVFLVVWRKIENLPSPPEQLPWLYGVARNVINNTRRSGRRLGRLRARLSAGGEVAGSAPEAQVVRREEDRLVLEAMSRLRSADRELLQLHAWEELSRSELAATFGISVGAADMRLKRALRRLERMLAAPAISQSYLADQRNVLPEVHGD